MKYIINESKRSGRSDTGRLRNFSQMNDDKLLSLLDIVRKESSDFEALAALETEWDKRNPAGEVLNIADELKALDNQRIDLAKRALNDALSEVFKNHSIKSISWAQKYTEYNDEGMYEGVSGPVVNVDLEGLERYEWQDKICYHPDPLPAGCAKEVKMLQEVLRAIGPRTLCDIIGDDEYVITATREKPVYSYKLTAEYAGY
jgi:hypothetical protein